jgi:hypothetical protein
MFKLADGQQMLFKVRTAESELILARPDLGIDYHLPVESTNLLLHPPISVRGDVAPSRRRQSRLMVYITRSCHC